MNDELSFCFFSSGKVCFVEFSCFVLCMLVYFFVISTFVLPSNVCCIAIRSFAAPILDCHEDCLYFDQSNLVNKPCCLITQFTEIFHFMSCKLIISCKLLYNLIYGFKGKMHPISVLKRCYPLKYILSLMTYFLFYLLSSLLLSVTTQFLFLSKYEHTYVLYQLFSNAFAALSDHNIQCCCHETNDIFVFLQYDLEYIFTCINLTLSLFLTNFIHRVYIMLCMKNVK